MRSHLANELLTSLPAAFAYRHKLIPLESFNGTLRVEMVDPEDQKALNDLAFLTGKCIEASACSEQKFHQQFEAIYGAPPHLTRDIAPMSTTFEVVEREQETLDESKLRRELDEISVVKLVNQIITEAIDAGASDIHLEAYEQQFRVRYRIDGVMQERMHPPLERKRAIISRLKIMADLDIAEKRRPQDGRIRVKRSEQIIDIRVSTLPTDFGEKIVLRILDKSQLNLALDKIGFEEKTLSLFTQTLNAPHGMILVTGPTGSGKTTTLYAALNHLNSAEVNILTIEDPIEYNLSGINQSQVKNDIGFTFAKALRAFLRQDPDIIMVGEIRDLETAEIAVRAALTGHLVLSTLHTNDAPSTLTRLLDMGLEPFLISSAVKLIIAQRLVRTICSNCRTRTNAPSAEHGFSLHKLDEISLIDETTFFEGVGCEKCSHTGYRGRTALFEVMPMSARIAELVNVRATAHEINAAARTEGMLTLEQSALAKIKAGVTTRAEVLREAVL